MSKDEIKEYLIYLIIDSGKVDTSNLYKKAEKVEKSEDTVAIIKEYED